MNINFKKFKKGFTLVETFVAILILVIAAVGPLSTLGNAIANGLYAQNEVQGNYFAQEGLEMVIGLRNYENNYCQANRLACLLNLYTSAFSKNSNNVDGYQNNKPYGGQNGDGYGIYLDANSNTPKLYPCQPASGSLPDTCTLYRDSNGAYVQTPSVSPDPASRTIFIRRLTFTTNQMITITGSSQNSEERKVVSIVTWNNKPPFLSRTIAVSSYLFFKDYQI